ncbi:MAG: UDP-N-acetylglucosamine 2-epimerase (non-hydrolyzing) [Vicinamibacterales bacterium]
MPIKVMTVFGTRPEIIRLSRLLPLLDTHAEHRMVHTGQNYDERLSDIFFEELGLRAPDVHLGVRSGSFAGQAAGILEKAEALFRADRPDRVLILGDTNSGLVAIVAARMGIPVFHMEAGNRCYDDRVPEEINRRIIDHCSTILMPYTARSAENLVREGIDRARVFVTGNPIFEVIEAYADRIDASDALARCEVDPGAYFLVTLHRAENVDDPARLARLFAALEAAGRSHGVPVIVSLHPRTRDRLARHGVAPTGVRLLDPFGFFDFVALERRARAVLTDSGTVQEECAIFGVPNVTLRDVTERPETLEAGSNVIAGSDPDDVARALEVALAGPTDWTPPAGYTDRHVAATVLKIVLGYTSLRRHGTSPA